MTTPRLKTRKYYALEAHADVRGFGKAEVASASLARGTRQYRRNSTWLETRLLTGVVVSSMLTDGTKQCVASSSGQSNRPLTGGLQDRGLRGAPDNSSKRTRRAARLLIAVSHVRFVVLEPNNALLFQWLGRLPD